MTVWVGSVGISVAVNRNGIGLRREPLFGKRVRRRRWSHVDRTLFEVRFVGFGIDNRERERVDGRMVNREPDQSLGHALVGLDGRGEGGSSRDDDRCAAVECLDVVDDRFGVDACHRTGVGVRLAGADPVL